MFAFVDGLGDQVLESMIVFYLTDDLSLLAVDCFSDGSPSEVTVPIGRILCQARGLCATAIILLHNHPSGNTKPSEADIRLTRRVEAAADAMNITLLDHFVMGRISLRSVGYM